MLALEGCSVGADHSALIALTACSACRESGATTPIKSPSCTTFAPSIESAAVVSTEITFAPNVAGRRRLANNIPGNFMSDEYLCRPVTKSRPSTFGTDVPAMVHLLAGATDVDSSTVL